MRSSGPPEPWLRTRSLSAAGSQAPAPDDKAVLPRDLRVGFLLVLLLFAGLALLGKAAHGQNPRASMAPAATLCKIQNKNDLCGNGPPRAFETRRKAA